MQGPRYFDPKKLPPDVKAKARKLLRERLDREAAERAAARRMTLLRLLEAICQASEKAAAVGLLRAELRLWKGGCPAPTDAEYAGEFVPELEAAIRRLETAESIGAFLESERARLSPG